MGDNRRVELNERTVKALPVPEAGNKVHFFAGAILQGVAAPPGFGICVTANNARSFVLDYRTREHRQRRITIGQWPTWSALQAVREARELRRRIDRGEDPLAERAKQATAAEDTLQAISEEFFKRDGASLRTKDDRERALERLVYPVLGGKNIGAIKRSDVVRLLDRIDDDHGPVMADRTLAYIRKVMNWHASRSDDFRSPIVRGMARTKPKERARERTLSDEELRAVWKAATGPYGALVKFVLLSSARRAEAAAMPWDELAGAVWTLPASRNKTKLGLVRPLPKVALALLPARDGKFVFTTDGETPISGFSKFKQALDKTSGVTGWTLHDCRRTSRTLMSRAGISTDIAERCLGHVIGGIRGIYDMYEYFNEKAAAYEALASLVDRIVNPQDNVTELRRAAQN